MLNFLKNLFYFCRKTAGKANFKNGGECISHLSIIFIKTSTQNYKELPLPKRIKIKWLSRLGVVDT